MNFKKFGYILLGVSLFFALDALAAKKKRKKIKPKPPIAKPAPIPTQPNTFSTLLLCSNTEGIPFWRLALVKGFRFPANFNAPSDYRLTVFNEAEMKTFLDSVPFSPQGKKIIIPLYADRTMSCKEFTISRTETMDSVLQAKYPELKSFKASEPGNGLNTVRVNCDGQSTRFMITYAGKQYFIEPVVFGGRTYYVHYAKDDPNFIKEKFERR